VRFARISPSNIGTLSGAKELYSRIVTAAREVCEVYRSMDSLDEEPFIRCYAEMIAAAVPWAMTTGNPWPLARLQKATREHLPVGVRGWPTSSKLRTAIDIQRVPIDPSGGRRRQKRKCTADVVGLCDSLQRLHAKDGFPTILRLCEAVLPGNIE
jgi:hypothetical protein